MVSILILGRLNNLARKATLEWNVLIAVRLGTFLLLSVSFSFSFFFFFIYFFFLLDQQFGKVVLL